MSVDLHITGDIGLGSDPAQTQTILDAVAASDTAAAQRHQELLAAIQGIAATQNPRYVHKLGAMALLPAHQAVGSATVFTDLGGGGDARHEVGVIEAWDPSRVSVAEWGTPGSGKPCLQYEHHAADGVVSGSYRTEVASYNDYFGPNYVGQTLWVGRSILPAAAPYSFIINGPGEDIITGQIHQNGSTVGHPPILMVFDRVSGLLRLRLHNWQTSSTLITKTLIDFGATLTEVPAERYDIKFRVKFSQSSGFIDNIKVRRSANVADYSGAWSAASGISGPTIGPGTTQLYIKDGLYRGGPRNGDARIRSRGFYIAPTEYLVDALFQP